MAHEAWSAAGQAGVALREWGDEWVAYAGATGHTHLLSAAAGQVLSEMGRSEQPLTPTALLRVLEGSPSFNANKSVDDATAQESMLRAMLLELARIGLATMRSP